MDLGNCRHKASVHQFQEGQKLASFRPEGEDGCSVIHTGTAGVASNLFSADQQS